MQFANYATSYAITADELYTSFPYQKYLRIRNKDAGNNIKGLLGRVLKYFFYLVVKDIIENNVTFKFPPGARSYLEMHAISGEDFARARQNGAFDDVDYLQSDFTGHQLYFRYNTRYGHWKKQLYVSQKFKDRITELTNQGKHYG